MAAICESAPLHRDWAGIAVQPFTLARLGDETMPPLSLKRNNEMIQTFRSRRSHPSLSDGMLRLVDRFDGLVGHPACCDYVARATARASFMKAHADQMAHFALAD